MFFPIMISIEDKEIVVVGGGEVALRKVKSLLRYKAQVKVISLEFTEGFKALEDKIQCIKASYKEEFIKDAYMVIAATSSKEINKTIGEYCIENQILHNRADDSVNSAFQIPAVLKRGDLTIAISTGASSPALAGKIKTKLEEIFTEDYEGYVALLGEMREAIIKNCSDEELRRNLLRELVDLDYEELKERRGKYEGSSRITRE